MKKVFSVLLCLSVVFACFSVVYADQDDIYSEDDGVSIYLDDRTLYLNNYVYSSSFEHEGYVIYTEGDLTLNLAGTSTVSSKGIFVDGNLIIEGDGILNICYLEVNGSLTINSGSLILTSGSDSYFGAKPDFPIYSYYDDNYFAIYNEFESTFLDYNCQSRVSDSITLTSYKLADLNNIYDDSLNLYYYNSSLLRNVSVETISGFVIYRPIEEMSVTYDGIDTYYVDLWNEYNDDGYANNFLEFLFEFSEWGKIVEFEVLDATNFYLFSVDNGYMSINTGDVIKENEEYVGSSTIYSINDDSNYEIGSIYMNLFARDDNFISLKMIGANGTYRYINVTSHEKEEPEEPHEDEKHEYVIPNTGIR